MMPRLLTLFVLVVACAFATPALAENWPHWRGPAFNGTSSETNLPVKFSKADNVAWAINLPGDGPSTPVVFGDRIFVSVATADNKLIGVCYDRRNGTELWQHHIATDGPSDNRSNKAGPSPVTDGKVVIFFFGSGDLAGYTVEGKKLWQRNICKEYGDFAFQWTFSSSPTIFNGVAYLPVMQRDEPVHGRGKKGGESYLLAFDPTKGTNVWRVVRPAKAAAESLEAFTTIIPHRVGDHDELLVAGGDCLTGHDPKTGKELWRWGTWNPTRIGHWRLVPSPIAGGGVVIACAPKGSPIYAAKLGGKGDISKNGLAWKSDGGNLSSDVATPAFYDGDFFVLNSDRRALSRVTPDGTVVWSIDKLPGRVKYEASPTVADGKVYTISHKGEADVIDAKSGKVLHSTEMGEARLDLNRPSVVVSQGQLFIKVGDKLYCIGKANVN
ncbi:MAG: PQQ-binding-like beta-propeller repeat protein [Phycisphaeraceae bacterium]